MMILDQIIEEALQNKLFTGIIVEVGDSSNILYNKAFGYMDRKSSKEINMDTLFDMASVTKIFTSTSILKLISDGRLLLESRIVDLLDDLSPYLNDFFEDITIRDLLTHGSGIHYWYPFYTEKDKSFIEILDKVLMKNDKRKAGTYSDLNFIILGRIISKIMEMPLDEALRVILLNCLEMKRTSYKPEKDENIASTEYGNAVETNMVRELGLNFSDFRNSGEAISGEVNDGNAYYYFQGVSGHAGVFSTIGDMRKIIRLYLNNGVYKDKELIKGRLINDSKINFGHDRGLGWALGGVFLEGYGHTGFTGTSIFIDDSLGIYITILTNRLNVENPVNINDFRMKVHQEVVKKFKEEK